MQGTHPHRWWDQWINNNNNKNKKRALTGKCENCGTNKYRFISLNKSTKTGGDIATSLGKLQGAEIEKV